MKKCAQYSPDQLDDFAQKLAINEILFVIQFKIFF